mmetsp:Transcript_56160/g.168102  ORF Transcript_56160/g.168102 Transcript_56160/m.168102 type:complete len:125 (-) Transcript_56160:246-620(-)
MSSGMEPLATYAGEVRRSYRERCVRRMGKVYHRMRVESCRAWFGFAEGDDSTMIKSLDGKRWSQETTDGGKLLLVPPPLGWELEESEDEGMDSNGIAVDGDNYDERIKSLTDIVSFMERKRLNF